MSKSHRSLIKFRQLLNIILSQTIAFINMHPFKNTVLYFSNLSIIIWNFFLHIIRKQKQITNIYRLVTMNRFSPITTIFWWFRIPKLKIRINRTIFLSVMQIGSSIFIPWCNPAISFVSIIFNLIPCISS